MAEQAARDLRPRIAFAASGVAVGATTTGLTSFVLVYYNQVMGLSPTLAGLALAIALVFDAGIDPIIGQWSDGLKSRLGRRLPFLMGAVVPMTVGYYLIWFPPFTADSQWAMFSYLLVVTVIVRFSISFFDVPANALIPELSRDYETRTAYAATKISLSWVTANAIGICMYAIWLNDRGGAVGSGILRKSGYHDAAGFIALAVGASAIAVIVAVWGLSRANGTSVARAATTSHGIWRNLLQVYRGRSILAVLGSALLFSAGSGMALALWIYVYEYYWELGSAQITLIQVLYLIAAFTSMLVLPRIARNRDKRTLALWLSGAFWAIDALPLLLRILGFMPLNGSPLLVPVLCLHAFVDGVLYNMVVTMVLSMLSDVVEQSLLKTGRLEEATVLAAQTLVSKTSTALGTLLGGAVLGLIAFPASAVPGAVPHELLDRLGTVYVPIIWTIGALSTLCILRYELTRDTRSQLLQQLESVASKPIRRVD